MMKELSINELIKDQTSRKLSKSYDNYDNVESIDIEENEVTYKVNATVNVLGRQSDCEILFDKEFHMINYDCDCRWCDEYSACGHIGAVFLKLNELNVQEFPFHYRNSKQERLLEEERKRKAEKRRQLLREQTLTSREMIQKNKSFYQSKVVDVFNDEKVEIEAQLNVAYGYDDHFRLSFKVGRNQKYVLKNITEFLGYIDNRENHKYGKNLEFIHSMDAFDEFAQKQIEFMRFAQNERMKNSQNSYYGYQPTLQRDIMLTTNNIDVFYDTFYEYDFDQFSLIDINTKVEVNMSEEDEVYVIELDPSVEVALGKKHLYSFEEIQEHVLLKRIELDEEGHTNEFISSLCDGPIVILKEEYNDFYKYVLSPIKDYLQINHLVELSDNEYQEIKVYGDVSDDGQIFFKIYYINENQDKVLGFNPEIMTNYQQDIVESYFEKYAMLIDTNAHVAYFDPNNEKTYEFIHEGIDKLREYAQIYVSEALKRFGQKTNYNITVGVKITNDLLSIDIESTDIPKSELSKVLEQYKRRKKFYRLKNGELLSLDSPQLEELEQFMDQYYIETKDIKDGHMELSKNRMFAIDQDGNHFEHIELDRKETFKEQLDKFYHQSQHSHDIPSSYQDILRDYQKDGYTWLKTLNDYGFNGILADDMGLGKTLQVIALLDGLKTDKPSIVVCPSSLIYNWEDEVYKFSQTLDVKCVVGNQQARQEIIARASQYKLLVTSYDYMRRDYELYEDTEFEYVILDEAQYIKNQKTKNAISVKKLKAKHKLALTGTPIENSLAELWSIMDFLMPQYLFNYHYFQKQYENDIVKNNDENKVKQLRKLVSPFILRRNKKDVLTELPEKIEKTQVIPFSEKESELYFASLAQVNEELQSVLNMENVNKVEILAMLTRLRQICCEPRIVYENIDNASSKMKACLNLLSNFKNNNQKVLLFSTFTKVLDLIADELSLMGIRYFMLTGQTSKEERRELVERFQNGEADVFLISLKAGGTGLNLTEAEAVIHFDPWWNVSAQNQATDRAYRIGQNRNVQVFKLVMKDSIEEKIVTLQEKKKELADLFVENNEGSIANMSKEEILELFS